MTYILILLSILSLYCLLVSYANKYSWYFVLITWSLIGAMYASFLLISASGNYSSIGYMFGDLDRRIFLTLIKNKKHFFQIVRLFNVTSAIYLTILSYFTISYFRNKKKLEYKRMRFSRTAILIFPIVYCVFYDPSTVYRLYCMVLSNDYKYLYSLVCALDLLLYITTFFYMLLPLFFLLQKRKSLSTYYKKHQLLGIALFVFLTDIIYLFTLRISSLRRLYIGNDPSFLIAIRTYGAKLKHEYAFYPLTMLIAIIVLFFVVGNFHLIRQEGIVNRFFLKSHTKNINKNLLGVFHSIKNTVFSYKLSVDEAINAEPELKKELLNNLSHEMNKYVENLTTMLNSDDIMGDFALEKCYISDVVKDALDSFKHSKNIKIELNYTEQIEEVYADTSYMKDAFLNILQNSLDAILARDKHGTITIKILREFDLVLIIFTDTGIGIEKKAIKNIFKPFYTTKSRIQNWGVGLSFVYKVIRMHKGNISIKSKVGEGTSLYVLLPRV